MKKNLFFIFVYVFSFLTSIAGACFLLDSVETVPVSDSIVQNTNPASIAEQEAYIGEYTYKTYADYFIDHGMANPDGTKNNSYQTTITGTGKKLDPYVINSTEDFWWISRYYYQYNSDYGFLLNCDIYINDEIFDEEGNPSGGDGVVYFWDCWILGGEAHFDGNNHKIFGMYANEQANYRNGAIFGFSKGDFENIYISNVYMSIPLGYSSAMYIFGSGITCTNIHILDGTVIATTAGVCVAGIGLFSEMYSCSNRANLSSFDDAAGLCRGSSSINYKLVDCVNYGKVSTNRFCGGIINGGKNVTLKNCKNYGEIRANGARAGGIIGYANGKLSLENCENYGDVIATGNAGGIASYTDSEVMALNCKNYGKLFSSAGTRGVGGIIAQTNGATKLFNCENYGSPIGDYYVYYWRVGEAEMIGKASGTGDIIIKHCKGNYGTFIIGYSASSLNIYIENFKLSCDELHTPYNCVIDVGACDRLVIKNLDVNIGKLNGNKFYLLSKISSCNSVEITDVYVKTRQGDITNTQCLYEGTNNEIFKKLDGVVLDIGLTNQSKKHFFGNNFVNHYMLWKTGEIGLDFTSSQGFFSARLSGEVLQNVGFEKKYL